ncbi:MAG: MFS transporter [Deinococcales bacterium]
MEAIPLHDKAWQRTLWIMFSAQLLSAIGFSTIFPFLSLYVHSLGSVWNLNLDFLAAMVFTGQGLTMMISSPIWGAVADRYGRKLMSQRAMFGGAIIILLMAFARSAEDLVFLRIIQGMITGTVAASNALVASVVPKERSGYAMGVMQTGLWTGVAIGPLIGGVTADFIGYRAAFVITAVLLVIGGFLVMWGVEEKFVAPSKAKGSVLDFSSWWKLLSSHGVSSVFGVRFLAFLSRTLLVPFAPIYMALLMAGSNRVGSMTGLMVGLSSAAGTFSAIYLGRLGDRFGHRHILLISTLIAALISLPQAFVTSVWQLLLLQVLLGISYGGIMPALSALLTHYTDQAEVGAVYGLDNSVSSASRAVAPLIGAAVVSAFGLRSLFIVMSLMLLAALWLSLRRLPINQTSALAHD